MFLRAEWAMPFGQEEAEREEESEAETEKRKKRERRERSQKEKEKRREAKVPGTTKGIKEGSQGQRRIKKNK